MAETDHIPGKILALDGLRGVAALFVILSHLSSRGVYLLPNLNLVGIGKSGVYLFFVLSAFLLTNQFLERKINFEPKAIAHYFKKRLLRVYPLYFVFLTFAFVSSLLMGDITVRLPIDLDVVEYIRHLLFLEGKGVAWTIPVEVICYAWLPIIAFICVRVFSHRFIPCALFLGTSILVSFLYGTSHLSNDNPLVYTPIFMMGSLLSLIYVNHDQSQRTRFSEIFEFMGWISLGCIVCVTPLFMSHIVGYSIERQAFWNEHLFFGLLWCLVLSACLFGKGPLRYIFEASVLRYLGKISFSLYLTHMTVIIVTHFLPLPTLVKGYIAIGVTVVLSHFSYFYFEKRFLGSSIKFFRG